MTAAVALRAVFGQDEANYGTRRYRVGSDGVIIVPPEVAVHLVKNGGFVALPLQSVAFADNAESGRPEISRDAEDTPAAGAANPPQC